MEVPAQEYVEALKEQRNQAHDAAAIAIARSVAFQKEAEALRARVLELEKKEG